MSSRFPLPRVAVRVVSSTIGPLATRPAMHQTDKLLSTDRTGSGHDSQRVIQACRRNGHFCIRLLRPGQRAGVRRPALVPL